jgi:hypothetical protein
MPLTSHPIHPPRVGWPGEEAGQESDGVKENSSDIRHLRLSLASAAILYFSGSLSFYIHNKELEIPLWQVGHCTTPGAPFMLLSM